MNFRTIAPSPSLAPYVAFYWLLEGAPPGPQRIFPDGSIDFAFQRGDVFAQIIDGERRRQAPNLLAGQMRTWVEIEPTGRAETFGIRFHPGGVWPFLRFPLHEVTDRILNLDDVLPKLAREIAAADDPAAQAERSLLARLPNTPPFEPWRVARGLSPRQVQRLFAERVGISPKRLARIARFQRALTAIERGNGARVAVDCGYYDQAHMVREFREFTGLAPTHWDGVAFLQDDSNPPDLL